MERSKGVVLIRGKEYETVAYRKYLFYKACPDGIIKTELLHNDDSRTVFKAIISTGETIKSTGHAQRIKGSTPVCKTSWFEVTETASIGRALSNGSYTETTTCSYEEMVSAGANREEMVIAENNQKVLAHVEQKENNKDMIVEDIRGLCASVCKGLGQTEKVNFMTKELKITGFKQLYDFEYRELVEVHSLLLKMQGEK